MHLVITVLRTNNCFFYGYLTQLLRYSTTRLQSTAVYYTRFTNRYIIIIIIVIIIIIP
jgi:hypothetical protein